MGTGFDVTMHPEHIGIIPRAVEHIFNGISQRQFHAMQENLPIPSFSVDLQFIEVQSPTFYISCSISHVTKTT